MYLTLLKAITISKILYKFSMTLMQLKLFSYKETKYFFSFSFLNNLVISICIFESNKLSEDRLSIGNVLTFLVLNQYKNLRFLLQSRKYNFSLLYIKYCICLYIFIQYFTPAFVGQCLVVSYNFYMYSSPVS